jgi:hypothetical protein
MKKNSLNQWLLAASVLTLSVSCQKKSMDTKAGSESQCEQQEDDSEDADETDMDQMSSIPVREVEEKASVEPIQKTEVVPVPQQEETTPSSSLTEAVSSAQLPLQAIPELEFIPEVDLEALAKMFSIEVAEQPSPAELEVQ